MLFATGRLIATPFALHGFGGRDGDPSVLYLPSTFGVRAGPTLALRASLPHTAPGWAHTAPPVAAIVVLVLGTGLGRRAAPAAAGRPLD